MIEPVADMLAVPHTRIYANNIFYNPDGLYKGFDDKEPTSRDGGKPKVMGMLIEKFDYKHVVSRSSLQIIDCIIFHYFLHIL